MARSFRLSVVSAALALSACGSDGQEQGPNELHVGWYELTAANGGALPQTITLTDECTLSVTGGYLLIESADTLSYRLEYRGPASCPGNPSEDGQTWYSYYTGPAQLIDNDIQFQASLVHLGLDTLTFVGDRLSGGRVRAVVPQIPSATGPDVTLVFEPTDQSPLPD